jgi:hypothetical protein
MVCRRQLCGRPCWHWRRPRRPALPIRDHGGPATYGYLRHPCRRGLPGRRDPDTTQRPPSQTVSTSEHATTPEHPCPGVVARTGPQAVNLSPVSGESMASGGYACGARIPTTNLPGERRRRCRRYSARWPPTRDGRSLRQAAPGCLLPRGRTRTGLEVETPTRSMGPMANKEVRGCAAPDHRPTGKRQRRGRRYSRWRAAKT